MAAGPVAAKGVEGGILMEAGKGIDEPWFVCRYLVQQAIKQHQRLTGRRAVKIHVPPLLEAVLQVDAGRNLDHHEPLRNDKELFGLDVVWGAKEFKIE